MKLFGTTESKITNDKNGKNVSHLGITEAVLVHCNIVNNDYKYIVWSIIRYFSQKIYIFEKFWFRNFIC